MKQQAFSIVAMDTPQSKLCAAMAPVQDVTRASVPFRWGTEIRLSVTASIAFNTNPMAQFYREEQYEMTLFGSKADGAGLRTVFEKLLDALGAGQQFGKAPPNRWERELQSCVESLVKA